MNALSKAVLFACPLVVLLAAVPMPLRHRPSPVAPATPTPAPVAGAPVPLPWPAWIVSNNEPFYGNAWEAKQIATNGLDMTITLDNAGCPASCDGLPLASGQLNTAQTYGYGLYQVSMQAANATSGTNTAFFTYAANQDEIDVELLSDHNTQISTNFYHKGIEGVVKIVNLPFDVSKGMHLYGIRWLPTEIQWTVDGAIVATDTSAQYTLPTMPTNLYMSLWTEGNTPAWFGPLVYTTPITAIFANPSFTPQ
jgi:beta-glucanase (GH16 family)